VTQVTLLMATTLSEPATLNRLATLTVTDRTTLTRNLRPLETQGLIRIESGADRRERQVTVTARGRQVLAKAIPLWEKLQTRFAETFGQERLQQLFGDLSELRTVSRGL
jgi:DNA-binding MarR family transcriptional regulator